MSIAEKLTTIAENEQRVFEAGEGAMWDIVQNYGNRRNYQSAFRFWEGVKEIKPKYPIKTTYLYEMFANCYELEYLPPFEVIPSTNATYAPFQNCRKLKGIFQDIPLYGNSNNAFQSCYELETIQKIIVSSAVTNINNGFQSCHKLKNVVFEGELCVSVDLRYSTELSKASITSLINVLSPNTSGLTCTLSQTAVNNAFTTSDWNTLKDTKTDWNIALV